MNIINLWWWLWMVFFFSSTYPGELWLWRGPYKVACEKNIRPKCGNLCFSVPVLKLSFICIVGSWHRLHGQITSSQCQKQKSPRLLWVSPCSLPRLSWQQLQAKFPLQGPVSRSLVSLATCQIRRQFPCPSNSSRCFNTNNSCRVAHMFCRPPLTTECFRDVLSIQSKWWTITTCTVKPCRTQHLSLPVNASGQGGLWLIPTKNKFKFLYGECVNVIARHYLWLLLKH